MMESTSMPFAQIELNSPGPFTSGGQIWGRIYVNPGLNTDSLSKITMNCTGRVETSFGECRGSFRRRRSSSSRKFVNDVLINESEIIFDSDEGNPLQYGPINFYRFRFQLPPSLPSSHKSIHGNISYALSLKVHSTQDPINDPDPITIPFMVTRHVDLNETELARLPAQLRNYRAFGLLSNCLLIRGFVTFHLSISKRGFVPGEFLQFQLDVSNCSSLHLRGLRALVIQDLVYDGDGAWSAQNRRHLRDTLTIKMGPEVKSGDSLRWEDSIGIPDTVQSSSIACGLIQTHHQLHVQLLAQSWLRSTTEKVILEGCIPLIIGDIPFLANDSSSGNGLHSQTPALHTEARRILPNSRYARQSPTPFPSPPTPMSKTRHPEALWFNPPPNYLIATQDQASALPTYEEAKYLRIQDRKQRQFCLRNPCTTEESISTTAEPQRESDQ